LRYLIVWMLGLQSILCALIIGAVLWGRQLTNSPDQQFMFDRCGTVLCFKGIMPDVTAAGEAMGLLREHTNRLPADIPVGEDGIAHVSIYPTNLRIQQISMVRKEGKPLFSVGWIIARYGVPCQVELDFGTRVILRYPFISAKVHFKNGSNPRLTVQDSVTEIMLHGETFVKRCESKRIVSRQWRGFASTYLYSERSE
jgi:hypothetical protein